MPADSLSRPNRRGAEEEENNAPMMAVFGGMFALMLVFLLLVNVFAEGGIQERLQEGTDDGLYRIETRTGGAGYVVIVFPEIIRIVETGVSVPRSEICEPGGAYRQYAERVYSTEREQLLFVILDNSVPTMADARNCLRAMMPEQEIAIGWVIADKEFLKSVVLDEIPSYIRNYVEGPLR